MGMRGSWSRSMSQKRVTVTGSIRRKALHHRQWPTGQGQGLERALFQGQKANILRTLAVLWLKENLWLTEGGCVGSKAVCLVPLKSAEQGTSSLWFPSFEFQLDYYIPQRGSMSTDFLPSCIAACPNQRFRIALSC